MPTATETELLDKTEFTPKGKDRQKVLESIARAVDDWCADDEGKPKSKQNWEKLSEAAQAWYNAAIDAIEARTDVPDFTDEADEAEDEVEEDAEPEDEEPEVEAEEEPDEESEDEEDEAEDEESEDEAEESEVASTAVSETGRRAKAPPPQVKKAKAKVEAKPAKIVGKVKEVKEAKANGKTKVKAKVAKVREREDSGISGSEYIRILTIKHPEWTSGEVHAQCKKDGYDVSGLLVSSIRSAAINVCKHLKAEGYRVPKFRQRASEA
jgi:chemotaxis protein histidine kinase CheA